MSDTSLLTDTKEALEEMGETFLVSRGTDTHKIKGLRSPKSEEIWFAGDADLREGDTLKSAVNSDEVIILGLRPLVHMDVQHRVYARVEPLAKHEARLSQAAQEKVALEQKQAEAVFASVRSIVLDSRQQELLITMMDAIHRIPNGDQIPFSLLIHSMGNPLKHKGLAATLDVLPADLRILSQERLLDESGRGNLKEYVITPRGSLYYRFLMNQRGTPFERVEANVHRYLDAARFQRSYPLAYAKWIKAESELWGAESTEGVTTVGHLCREAMQEFAHALVIEYNPPDAPADKARTQNRVWAVLDHATTLGKTEMPFLKALMDYWEGLNKLVQRQEHGGQKEGEPISWQDSRRVVFQTAIVMLEIDGALHRPEIAS